MTGIKRGERTYLTLSVPRKLIREVEAYLATEHGKRHGYRTKSEFCIDAIRKWIITMKTMSKEGEERTLDKTSNVF